MIQSWVNYIVIVIQL